MARLLIFALLLTVSPAFGQKKGFPHVYDTVVVTKATSLDLTAKSRDSSLNGRCLLQFFAIDIYSRGVEGLEVRIIQDSSEQTLYTNKKGFCEAYAVEGKCSIKTNDGRDTDHKSLTLRPDRFYTVAIQPSQKAVDPITITIRSKKKLTQEEIDQIVRDVYKGSEWDNPLLRDGICEVSMRI